MGGSLQIPPFYPIFGAVTRLRLFRRHRSARWKDRRREDRCSGRWDIRAGVFGRTVDTIAFSVTVGVDTVIEVVTNRIAVRIRASGVTDYGSGHKTVGGVLKRIANAVLVSILTLAAERTHYAGYRVAAPITIQIGASRRIAFTVIVTIHTLHVALSVTVVITASRNAHRRKTF